MSDDIKDVLVYFVCQSPEFNKVKYRLFDKDRNLVCYFTLSELISKTFRRGKFEYWGVSTGLKDKNGKEIYEGDILRFDDDNGIWQAPVIFERGLFGLDVHHPKQVKNPDGWDKDYDKVESRGWAVQWGYEETGTAFTYRTPLAKATIFRGSPEEYEKSEQKKLYEKFGYGDYYVMAEVIGNIHENGELLEEEGDDDDYDMPTNAEINELTDIGYGG